MRSMFALAALALLASATLSEAASRNDILTYMKNKQV